ncbi:MAG TPA: hypothetical protein VIG69_06960 [Candidatus Methylomirabilis sp.]
MPRKPANAADGPFSAACYAWRWTDCGCAVERDRVAVMPEDMEAAIHSVSLPADVGPRR